MSKVAAVLFDFFDTLCRIDEYVYLEGKKAGAAILGVPPDAFARAWVESQDAAQEGRLPDLAARVRHVAAALGRPAPHPDRVDEVAALERATLLRASTLHADALPTLRVLRAIEGLRLGLVSNASRVAEDLVPHLGLAPFFETLAWSFRAGVTKPHAAIYLWACQALGVEPTDCLFVGDGNARELDGARAVGMRAVRIERTFSLGPYRKAESRTYDVSIGDLGRLPELLDR